MLYVIHGTDIETTRAKAHGLFDALKEKKPDASAGTLTAEQVSLERLDELVRRDASWVLAPEPRQRLLHAITHHRVKSVDDLISGDLRS